MVFNTKSKNIIKVSKVIPIKTDNPATLNLVVMGEFDLDAAVLIRREYEINNSICNKYVIDLTNVSKFHSIAIGCLVVLFEYIKKENKNSSLHIKANKEIRDILSLCNISTKDLVITDGENNVKYNLY